MATNLDDARPATGAAAGLFALIAAESAGTHAYVRNALVFAGAEGTRSLADAVHFLCTLHGRHPGLIDQAYETSRCDMSRAWLEGVAAAFTTERLYVTRLAVAAGPVPSTPGSAESEAAVAGQCHALGMLARSERRGCALGAAVALVLDWKALRPLLDHAAARLGVPTVVCRLPDLAVIGEVIDAAGADAPVARAMRFGASQILVQHRGLFDLLEARQSARREV